MAMFRNGSVVAVGTNPVSNATADLDGDGHLDLLFSNYISDNVSVVFGDGHGNFTAGAPVPVVNGPRQIMVGDLDGDGDIDFIATNLAAGSVTVALNNGNGTFTSVAPVAVGAGPRGLGLADVDGDGDLDFMSVNYGANTISVMLNNGSGAFTQLPGSPLPVGSNPVQMVVADFDGDGALDLAVTSNTSNSVALLLNNGDGTFGVPVSTASGAGPRGLTAGDVDGDGDSDLVVGNFSNSSVSILLNNGDGSFAAATSVATGSNPYDVKLGDLDGDGDLDMVVSSSGSGLLNVFLNNGAGTFTPASGSPITVGISPGGVALGDFDGDGDLDISSTNFGSNTSNILINRAASYSVAGAPSTLEGTAPGAGGELVFTISRSATSEAEDITYTLAGTATAGTDYTAPSGTISFAIGQSTAEIRVAVSPDAVAEIDETVTLTLTDASGEGIISAAAGSATGTILDDDPATYSITGGTSSVEGTAPDAGGELVFTVTRTLGTAAADITYSLGGTAASGTDFVAPSGTVSFAAGETTAEIRVAITSDALTESAETIVVTLTGASDGGTIDASAAEATGTIIDDDSPPEGSPTANLADGRMGRSYTVREVDLLAGFSDADGDVLTVENLAASVGTLTDNGDGTWTLKPPMYFVGDVALSYQVSDGQSALAAVQSFEIVYRSGNGGDVPVIEGTPGADRLQGTDGNDVFLPLDGDDDIFGGDGNDSVILPGDAEGYVFVRLANGKVGVVDIDPSNGNQGADVLDHVEFIRFGDETAVDKPLADLIDMHQPAWTLESFEVGLVASTYQLFLGMLPSEAGFEYLILSDANSHDLSDPYYAPFNAENKYLNFTTNLATGSPSGAAWFEREFGGLTYEQAVEKAFDLVITDAALIAAGGDPAASKLFFLDAEAYFTGVAADRIVPGGVELADAVKMALLSSVLYEAVKADIGSLANAVNDVADHLARVGYPDNLPSSLFETA